ncbi:MAG: ABC transporter substrate-binding protein [Vicinamibacteria bacterium]|nr:ABC transporter substrate-binding protein [Vicinamibacteria bacterium]
MSPSAPRRRSLLACLLAAGLAGACSAPPREGPLRIALHGDPVSLDPHSQNEILSQAVLGNVYDTLVGFDRHLKVRPGLARRWENPDELTWRFHLDPAARFHDGRAVQSADVVASLERARQPGRDVASFLVEIQAVRGLDPLTVELVTRRPFAVLLNKLAFAPIVPRDAPAKITRPLGSGPYRFGSFEPGRRLQLELVAGDWHRPPATLAMEFVPVADAGARADALLRGEFDAVIDLPALRVQEIDKSACCRVAVVASATVEYVHLNPAVDPRFADSRLREAIDLALDREGLVDAVTAGHGIVATQAVSPGVFGFDPELPAVRRDVARARALLKEAGYPEGLELTLEYREGRDGAEIARALGEAGIRVRLAQARWSELYPRLVAREVGFYYGGVVASTADASDVLDSFLHSFDPASGYGATNLGNYDNPELDRLVEQASTVRELSARRGLLQAALRLATADRFVLPLIVPADLYGLRRDLHWEPSLALTIPGREMRRGAPAAR